MFFSCSRGNDGTESQPNYVGKWYFYKGETKIVEQSNSFTSYTPKDCENSQTMKFLKMVMLQSMDIRKMLLQIIVIIQQERQFISQMKKHFTIINPMEH